MGDVLSLIERAEQSYDEEQAAALEKKIRKNRFTLEDFLDQFNQVRKMGGLGKMLEMMPGAGGKVSDDDIAKGEEEFRHMEALIRSMTPEERRNPEILDASRRRRIAAGAGQTVNKVNNLIKRYDEARKMMKQFSDPKKMKKNRFMRGFMQ